ncbi:integrating conjugative element protein, PFL_4705 family [Yersinia enterocolitica]|nr:putative exported domain protein [Yersinia enterocolitica]CNK10086.1 integrating conjugative element protein%2C PFL_4705 family [Yersinia enterocolitica]VFS95747.1 integrating conjugative element protein, PFL_4705 family [Yersinia enterocolitica]VTP82792.1 integrating conjugative element protein, PFL_4705 family [Yersinia enterocolitica subsp. enterocolitica]
MSDLTEEELQILGIEGDTPADTLRTLVARLKVIQDKQNSLDQRNTRLSEENTDLKENDVNIDNRIRDAVNVVKQQEEQARQTLQAEQQRLATLIERMEDGGWDRADATGRRLANRSGIGGQ